MHYKERRRDNDWLPDGAGVSLLTKLPEGKPGIAEYNSGWDADRTERDIKQVLESRKSRSGKTDTDSDISEWQREWSEWFAQLEGEGRVNDCVWGIEDVMARDMPVPNNEQEEEEIVRRPHRKRKRQIITHARYTKSQKQKEDRLEREEEEEDELERISKYDFLIVLSERAEKVAGQTDEEVNMPISLCQAIRDFECESRDDIIEVRWYRQRDGDPNKPWMKGCLSGGSKKWVGEIERGSVLLVGASLTSTGNIKAQSMKALAETKKSPYTYQPNKGLVPKTAP